MAVLIEVGLIKYEVFCVSLRLAKFGLSLFTLLYKSVRMSSNVGHCVMKCASSSTSSLHNAHIL